MKTIPNPIKYIAIYESDDGHESFVTFTSHVEANTWASDAIKGGTTLVRVYDVAKGTQYRVRHERTVECTAMVVAP